MEERHFSPDGLTTAIEALRARLNKQAGRSRLTSKKVVRTSQRLDRLLLKYYRKIYQVK